MIPLPRGLLLAFFSIPILFVVGSFIYHPLLYLAFACNGLLVLACVVDLFLSLRVANLGIHIKTNQRLYAIGRSTAIDINLQNFGSTPMSVAVKFNFPEEVEDETVHNQVVIQPAGEVVVPIVFRPTRRGTYICDLITFRMKSRLGFFAVQFDRTTKLKIPVYPDVIMLKHYLKLVRSDRTYRMGVNRNRWRGHGTELDSLREYHTDDDSRYIDWKASTRQNKLVTKTFQSETNNNVVIAVDCGRLMTGEQDGLSSLDHAVNALLVLSHIVLNAGDILSITAFADKVVGEVQTVKGKSSIAKVTDFITGLEPTEVEANYDHVFQHLRRTHRRHSLFIFLTDLIDDVNYELFQRWIRDFSKRHLVVFVALRDVLLFQHTERPLEEDDDLYIRAAAQEMHLHRSAAIAKLRQKKVSVLDILPKELTASLMNKYLEVRAKNLL